ncbi:hypothetical protein H5410_017670 [Solanum commersonii]|uniref:Uncharacterized protein n=1 Tax=Solanum commersonii TaxID=4109 RepID=A0A9J5ZZQ9_SOLCO|nr:hypothetical protein H5410_017670 [Solanum commersonii]
MAGREVREYTNLTDPKDKKWGKGKDKIDDEEIAFHRMVSKMQDVTGERGGYLHGRGVLQNAALDSDDLLYLKEQMEAEEDAERLLRRTEKPVANSSPALLPLPLRVEPKPKSGIRFQFISFTPRQIIALWFYPFFCSSFIGQQDLLKRVVEVKSKKPKVSNSPVLPSTRAMPSGKSGADNEEIETLPVRSSEAGDRKIDNPVKSLLSVYDSSDDDDD